MRPAKPPPHTAPLHAQTAQAVCHGREIAGDAMGIGFVGCRHTCGRLRYPIVPIRRMRGWRDRGTPRADPWI